MRHIRIVLIDDDITIGRVIKRTFRHYDIVTFNDSVEGLKYINDNLPDIVMLDLNMPKMTGVEILQVLKLNDNTCHIPVIIMSGDDDESMKEKTISLHAEAYIAKPFTKEDIQDTLDIIIKRLGMA